LATCSFASLVQEILSTSGNIILQVYSIPVILCDVKFGCEAVIATSFASVILGRLTDVDAHHPLQSCLFAALEVIASELSEWQLSQIGPDTRIQACQRAIATAVFNVVSSPCLLPKPKALCRLVRLLVADVDEFVALLVAEHTLPLLRLYGIDGPILHATVTSLLLESAVILSTASERREDWDKFQAEVVNEALVAMSTSPRSSRSSLVALCRAFLGGSRVMHQHQIVCGDVALPVRWQTVELDYNDPVSVAQVDCILDIAGAFVEELQEGCVVEISDQRTEPTFGTLQSIASEHGSIHAIDV
jgi:hypothetical protein